MYLFTSPKNKNLTPEICEVFVTSLFSIPVIYQEKICGEWVLSTSVCGTGSFSARTATHSMSASAHEMQTFLYDLRSQNPPTAHPSVLFAITSSTLTTSGASSDVSFASAASIGSSNSFFSSSSHSESYFFRSLSFAIICAFFAI